MPLDAGNYAGGDLASLKHDIEAKNNFKIIIDKQPLKLQFPPKITSDGKSARWQDDHWYGYEEFARWMGAYARKINIELNYVIWNKWNQEKISTEIRKIKGHLYKPGQKAGDKVPFIFVSGWRVIEESAKDQGGTGLAAFRLINIGIEYSKEYVGSGKDCWPLHTKANLECKLITQSGSTDGNPKYRERHFNGSNLPIQANIEWY